MLSIKNITDSKAAVSYFEKDDYYAGKDAGGDSEGQWWGAGADAMGLSGAVDREQFKALLDGELPDGTVLGTVREKGGDKVHKPGWDLTFSAPKSVSVLSEVGGDERLHAAHDQAVKETLEWMQDNIAGHRKRDMLGVRHEHDGNLAVALFQHVTSRNKDPQLHTHAVVTNAIQDANGDWRSLNSKPLYDHMMSGGNIYRAALARNVQQLGYQIERVHRDGRWEISAVPETVQEMFSTRAQDIREAMAERGIEGAENAERAALMTRNKKSSVNHEQLVDEWLKKSQAAHFDPRATVGAARLAGDQTEHQEGTLGRAVKEARTRLSDQEAVFSHSEMIRWSLAGAMGQADIGQVEAEIKRAEQSASLQQTLLGGTKAWTTQAAKRQEELILRTSHESRGKIKPAMSVAKAREQLSGTSLNEGQRRAAELIVTTEDRFVGVLGRPGVGKTFMLGAVKILLERQGYTVKGMAGNSEAARTIEQDSGIASTTLQKHLMLASRDLTVVNGKNPIKSLTTSARVKREVWVIDESSQLDARGVRRTMYLADKLGARVVMLGDTKQLAAINAGKPFEQLLRAGMKHAEMDEILRQKNQVQLKAIRQTIAGDVSGAITTLKPHTKEIEDREKRLKAIVKDWAKLGAGRATTAVLTARNQERIALNEAMREVLRKEGKLRDEKNAIALTKVYAQRMDKVEAEVYQPGDLVRFGRGVQRLGISAGQYLRVAVVDKVKNELLLESTGEDRTRVRWNPRSVAASAKNGVELYRERITSLALGERVQWGINNNKLRLDNGQVLTNGQMMNVEGYDGKTLKLKSDSGGRVVLDAKQFAGQHWDHAYATTVYKSQGRTEDRVLVNAEANQTELFNQKAFLVAISRQRESISLYTDNTGRFVQSIEKKTGDKTSVQDAQTEARLSIAVGTLREISDNWTKTNKPTPAAPEQIKETDKLRDGLNR